MTVADCAGTGASAGLEKLGENTWLLEICVGGAFETGRWSLREVTAVGAR